MRELTALEDAPAAPMADIGRACILIVSPEMLSEFLQLPAGCEIDAAVAPYDQPGVLHLRVRGAGWPTKAGMLLPQVRGTVKHLYADGAPMRPVIEWAFPEAPNVESKGRCASAERPA